MNIISNSVFSSQVETILNENPILFQKIADACKIDKDKVPDILEEVVKFLKLISQHGKKLTPSLLVDYAWHEFILCTRYYHEFCQEQYGRYIHHHPGGEEKENKKQFILTIQLYQKHFGNPPAPYWGHIVEEIPSSADCGPCSSI